MTIISLRGDEIPVGQFVGNATITAGSREECIAGLYHSYAFAQDIGSSTRIDTYVNHDGIEKTIDVQVYVMIGGDII